MTRFRRWIAAGVVASLVLGGACSDGEEPDLSAPNDVTSSSGGTDDADDGAGDALRDETFHVAESLDRHLVVRDAASASAQELVTLTAAEAVSGRIVCLVIQQVGDWVEVDLPTGPAGRTGWVARDDVALSRHRFRIEVARGARTLTLFTGSVVALSTPVALGPDAPAAGERRFITELVQPPDPAGVYGAYAYGLSGASNDVAAYASGQGVVAIHGVVDGTTLGTRCGRRVDRGGARHHVPDGGHPRPAARHACSTSSPEALVASDQRPHSQSRTAPAAPSASLPLRSWRPPSTHTWVTWSAMVAVWAANSSGVPNGSRVPNTNRHGTSMSGKCSTRSRSGLPIGWSG